MNKNYRLKERERAEYSIAIFDFDGTIVNGETALVETLNALALEFGYNPITLDQIPELKMMGAKNFILKRLKIPIWRIPKLEKRGREEYNKRVAEMELFAGIKEVIVGLKQKSYKVGIISSNSALAILQLLETHGINVDFVYSGSSLFGKARVIKRMLKEKNINPTEVIYIGDEVRDVEACRKIGIDIIAVGWGFNAPEALQKAGAEVVNEPSELLNKLISSDRRCSQER